MTSRIDQLTALGQSLWYDNIERRLLHNGELATMISRGDIRGVTSNPAIFQNAIARSHDYDAALTPMAWAGWNAEQIFWQLAVEDIRAAADLFLPLYRQTSAGDGYVSLEVNPRLAHDTAGTVAEARRLWAQVDRPNLLIKIPATLEGLPAIRQVIASGINVNVTLIFSIARYRQVMDAYLSGLEQRVKAGQPIVNIASVASFFVSRIDTKVDKNISERAPHLLGKLAIANAKLAYQEFRQVFEHERFARLRAVCETVKVQRPLWASTSTKNPAFPDTLYVDNLIGPHTVNTAPPQTVLAFADHGLPRLTLEENLDEAQLAFEQVEKLGVSMDGVTRECEVEGVKAFVDAYEGLLKTIEARRLAASAELGALGEAVAGATNTAVAGVTASAIAQRVARLEADSTPVRIWAHDASLWTSDPEGQAEIRRRLGWLELPGCSDPNPYRAFAQEFQSTGYDRVLLLGMGGSSLAPEVMSLVFSTLGGQLQPVQFAILDSTDPGQVLATARKFPVERTLFIVSSKSGGTAEINAFLDFFWARAIHAVGDRAAEHFIVITDPGTALEKLAKAHHFRKIFLGDPNVGGRFSALSPFGLVPAALMGLDVASLLQRAALMMHECSSELPAARNPGLVLGAILGEAALLGRDKLTIFADPPWKSFGSWLEQLIAESSGKQGVGIVPVDLEPPPPPAAYGPDRLFIYMRQNGKYDRTVTRLKGAGFPVLTFPLGGLYDLAAEFYRWEFATAVACAVLGVNAFDQPDVQDSKDRTKAKIKEYREMGKLFEGKRVAWEEGADEVVKAFLAQARAGDFVALNAYLPRNRSMEALLRRLRVAIMRKTGCATTVGFGPRFLHSTGQLHKGGADNGLFLQITADPAQDVVIPVEGLTFGVLERAQSLGDLEALQARRRRALRVHLPGSLQLEELVQAVEKSG